MAQTFTLCGKGIGSSDCNYGLMSRVSGIDFMRCSISHPVQVIRVMSKLLLAFKIGIPISSHVAGHCSVPLAEYPCLSYSSPTCSSGILENHLKI